jgi:hypothetical protein
MHGVREKNIIAFKLCYIESDSITFDGPIVAGCRHTWHKKKTSCEAQEGQQTTGAGCYPFDRRSPVQVTKDRKISRRSGDETNVNMLSQRYQ